MTLAIRKAAPQDWPAIWAILEPICREGATFALSRSITEAEAREFWAERPQETFVAADDAGSIVGTYFITPNQAGGGAHVCNAGYAVGKLARGRGVASRMCEHSQAEALARGFAAMQFNFVISTNETAVKLWRRHGFEVVGTLPGAFDLPGEGYVDVFVMYKRLAPS